MRSLVIRSLALLGLLGLTTSACATVVRVSVDDAGVEANDHSVGAGLSSDGRSVVFTSPASNLVPGDSNGVDDVFVHDAATATTTRVSVSNTGAQAPRVSRGGVISGNGRYVAFHTFSANLVSGDTNLVNDVFVRDVVEETTTRVSLTDSDEESTGGATWPSISSDGRYVTFESRSANLVPGDANGERHVFLRDTVAGTTTRVSIDSNGEQGNHLSAGSTVSNDGRYVAFQSHASNLVPGDANGFRDVFVHDTLTGTTDLVSVGGAGAGANHESGPAQISGDGRFVVFISDASNLVAGDTNGARDAFVRDLASGTTVRVSLGDTDAQASASSSFPAISSDGRYVTFSSPASDLVAGDTNDEYDIFVRDLLEGTTTRVSVASSGAQATGGPSLGTAVSADGGAIAFTSYATNLVPGDTNRFADVFLWRRSEPVAAASGRPSHVAE